MGAALAANPLMVISLHRLSRLVPLPVAALAPLAVIGGALAGFGDSVATTSGVTAGTLVLTVNGDVSCAARTYGGTPTAPGVGGHTGCVVPPGSFTGPTNAMRPGSQVAASFTATNVGSLPGTLSLPAASIVVAGAKGSCPPGSLTIAPGVFDPALAPDATVGLSLTAGLAADAPDGCQGATFTVDIPFLLSSVTGMAFADQVTSANNVFTADVLPPPTALTAIPNAVGTEIALAWTPGPGDFSTSWQIARESGAACNGWVPTTPNLATGVPVTSFTDTTVSEGTIYCYAVRGAAGNWVSAYTAPATTSTPARVRLYYHDASGANDPSQKQLITGGATGYQQFGCLLVAVTVCLDLAPDSYTLPSTGTYFVPTNQGWRTQIDYTAFGLLQLLEGRTFTFTAWYVAPGQACGSLPSSGSGQRIASVSVSGSVLLGLVSGGRGQALLQMTGDPGFVAPTGPQTVCVQMAMQGEGLLSAVSYLAVENGALSWIEGPFE